MIRSLQGKTPRIAPSAFVSEAAYIVGDVEIGEDSNIMPCAVIRGDMGAIRIGSGVSIEDNCVVHSGSPHAPSGDVTIDDMVIIGHGTVLNCRRVGHHVLIGMNATVLHDAEIGNYCIIAACALIRQGMKIPDNSFVAGVPAEIKGTPSPDQLWWVNEGIKEYEYLAQLYKREGL
ncbi:MAG: gamma carbonic anhydrase family protein [Deltaproteobacteria bacterium]|nr:gamma carbonic anhydrase family protein [Deltaproteobacteria bacterium]